VTVIARTALAVAIFVAAASVACGDGSAGDETSTPELTTTSTSTATAGAPPLATETPAATAGPQTYEVASGDTLFDIAAEFGVSAEALAEANGITDPTLLQIGQVLTIPPADATPEVTATATGAAEAAETATPAN
jgi:LysM repeat protein